MSNAHNSQTQTQHKTENSKSPRLKMTSVQKKKKLAAATRGKGKAVSASWGRAVTWSCVVIREERVTLPCLRFYYVSRPTKKKGSTMFSMLLLPRFLSVAKLQLYESLL